MEVNSSGLASAFNGLLLFFELRISVGSWQLAVSSEKLAVCSGQFVVGSLQDLIANCQLIPIAIGTANRTTHKLNINFIIIILPGRVYELAVSVLADKYNAL